MFIQSTDESLATFFLHVIQYSTEYCGLCIYFKFYFDCNFMKIKCSAIVLQQRQRQKQQQQQDWWDWCGDVQIHT